MLLYSTLLDINDTMGKDDFIRLAIKWNQGSPREEDRVPNINWNGERNISFGDNRVRLEIEEYRNENIIAIRYEKQDENNTVWDTDLIMNFNKMKMSIRLDRSFSGDVQLNDTSFSTPFFVSLLIREGYLKPDGEFQIRDRAISIGLKDIDTMVRVINGTADHQLPIVYVSRTPEGNTTVNIKSVVNLLKGIAHVFVQEGDWIDDTLGKKCNWKNEYNGAIGIYFPNNTLVHRKYLYNAHEAKNGYDDKQKLLVLSYIQAYSNSKKIDPLYTFLGVKTALLNDKYSSKKESLLIAEREREKTEKEANALISSVDMEIVNLQNEIAELKEHNTQLTRDNISLSGELQGLRTKLASNNDMPVIVFGEENEFFPDEIKEIVLEALEKTLPHLKDGRRQDVLKDLLNKNDNPRIMKERSERLRAILKDYRELTAKVKQELKDMGFIITEYGKHYKLTYHGDDRYTFTLACTGSDVRGGKNLTAEIINRVF